MKDPVQIYQGKFIDRNPRIRSAGKLFPVGEGAQSCLTENYPRPLTPPVVQKFLHTRRPNPGARVIFYGKANDPNIAEHMTHGVCTRHSLSAGSLINLPLKTLFQQKLSERKESLYYSHQRKPLGKSYDQTTVLPASLDLNEITFGKRNIRGLTAGAIISPPKSIYEVDEETKQGHELYVVTHNDYNAGEQRDRKYDLTKYEQDRRFGMETPHFNDGRHVARCLRWLHELKAKERANIVSKRVDDFREKFQPQVGKTLDPISDTLKVPPGHTFGILLHPDKYGVGDVLHYKTSKNFLRGKDRHRATLAAVQQHLKKMNYHNFGSLLEAFRHYDKNGDGKIDKDELKRTCVQFGLDLDADLLNALIEYCDVDKDGLINFIEFANFLNWKDKMPISKFEEKVLTQGKKNIDQIPSKGKEEQSSEYSEALIKQEDLILKEEGGFVKTPKTLSRAKAEEFPDYITTSYMINAVVGGPTSTYYRTCGVPTVRSDIAPPRIRRTADRTNYGDDPDVFGLLCPSIFTEYMVYEKDFFKPRPKDEIAQIFRNVGIKISDQNFEELWKMASMRHPKGLVSVEAARKALHDMEANQNFPLMSCSQVY